MGVLVHLINLILRVWTASSVSKLGPILVGGIGILAEVMLVQEA